MRLKGAMTVLNKRAEFYGKSLDWLIDFIDQGNWESHKVIEAHDVYKREGLGLVWSGLNGVGYTTKEQSVEEYLVWRGDGFQLNLFDSLPEYNKDSFGNYSLRRSA
tara:strand:- start:285 stop:602 length:318 start_codon:yes stop_codon:yes gene_type:complete